jgi:hypothetical protein
MLHLYIIADDQPKPTSPSAMPLPFAGELDETTFENLQQKGIISDRFDVYSTFRWDTALINQMRVNIQKKNMTNDADVQKLLTLFNTAQQSNSGLIAYGD